MIEVDKEELFCKLKSIGNQWHNGTRPGNDGNQGNTLEDLLEIPENNLSLPDYGLIELKTQKAETGSLVTLFHKEPSPPASVPKMLLSLGWKHRKAGIEYPEDEMSFRMTTPSCRFTSRGFTVNIRDTRIEFDFCPEKVKRTENDITGAYSNIGEWLDCVMSRIPSYLDFMPVFWEREEFEKKCKEKFEHTVFIVCKTRKQDGVKQFFYDDAFFLSGFNPSKLYTLFEEGVVFIDFDARTRHNHGTKLRIKKQRLKDLFDEGEKIF